MNIRLKPPVIVVILVVACLLVGSLFYMNLQVPTGPDRLSEIKPGMAPLRPRVGKRTTDDSSKTIAKSNGTR